MLTLSKPISTGQAQAYHKSEFANAKENYYTEGERVRGQWQGQLAERWELKGEVNEEQFARLSEGQHPMTGEALIRRQQAREYVNAWGETVRTMEHRAGWDATFSAPKSVSVTALVGGDDRVRDAHRESVRVALDQMEKYAHRTLDSWRQEYNCERPHSSLAYRTLAEFSRALGYGDVESKQRFPHPHSLDYDGGEIYSPSNLNRETPAING